MRESDLEDLTGDLVSSISMGEGCCAFFHSFTDLGLCDDAVDLSGEDMRSEIYFFDHRAGARFSICKSVRRLIVAYLFRDWNDDRRHAPESDLKDSRASARNDERRRTRRHFQSQSIEIRKRLIPVSVEAFV